MSLSVLLIEDNSDHAVLAKRAIEKDGTFQVKVARTGREGLECLSNGGVELIISDYNLPDQTGLDILRIANERKVRAPFIMMTGQGDETLAATCLKEGAYDYVVKSPSYLSELPHTIQNVLTKYRLEREKEELTHKILKQNTELAVANLKLQALSVKDELTALYNHRCFQEHVESETARAKRYQQHLCCVMIDLDHFKQINDNFGHQFGDKILRRIAQVAKGAVRESDFLARYGGEEFVLLLPNTPYEGATVLADRLLELVRSQKFEYEGQALSVTISMGISSFVEDHIRSTEQLVEYADRALYQAKASGRDRICLHSTITDSVQQRLPQLQISRESIVEMQTRIHDISETVKKTYIAATRAMMMALDAKDVHTKEHSASVARYSRGIAEYLGLRVEEQEVIEHAGLLHDIGKVGIPDEILFKPGKLSAEEFAVMKEHPTIGYQILKPIRHLREELPFVLYHHEWYNGQGYPQGLKGREIPVGARILHVADSFDTMLQRRIYKDPFPIEVCLTELLRCSLTQFDPKCVKALVEYLLSVKKLAPEGFDAQLLTEKLEADPYK